MVSKPVLTANRHYHVTPDEGFRMPWDDGLDRSSPAYGIAADLSESIRVVAGPGTGKSFGLKRRVARLLETGVPPSRILPVTFTNVAAEDLQREPSSTRWPRISGSSANLALRPYRRTQALENTTPHFRELDERSFSGGGARRFHPARVCHHAGLSAAHIPNPHKAKRPTAPARFVTFVATECLDGRECRGCARDWPHY